MGLMNFLKRVMRRRNLSVPPNVALRRLINREAEVGGRLFGSLPEGRTRTFFCMEPNVWIWHEGWRDRSGSNVFVTTRYEIKKDHILKIQDGHPYHRVSIDEARNLLNAARLYRDRVARDIYTRPA